MKKKHTLRDDVGSRHCRSSRGPLSFCLETILQTILHKFRVKGKIA